ncbi:integral membrane transport protein [Streptomyces sp. bgisy022]|uniref:integral membrane transport protein n=1 Tax=Streptomyces sp. bgisy022 TaxID=3413769 RepID=UPI003D765FB4
MSAVTDAVRTSTAPGNPIGQSVRDSLIVAKRNLIRMARIPNLVRSVGFRFNSRCIPGQGLSAGEGSVA